MLDKRRFHGYVSPPHIASFIITVSILCCLSFWILTESSDILSVLPEEKLAPGYLLLVPENLTSTSAYSINDLSTNDETTLIDIKDFKFILNHDPCNKTQPLLLIIIHSAPGNFEKRATIRDTWGKSTNDIIVLFTIGQTDEYKYDVIEENEKYHDIVQGNFVDAYKNMTYKHVMALKWATYYCPNTKYVLKLDDDVFVNMKAMIDFLKHVLSPWGARRLILCDSLPAAPVKRTYRSKWRVSPDEYPGKRFPGYCAGWAILYSPDSVFLLYREAQKEPYFWIDDVHITGTVAIKVNLTHSPINSLVLKKSEMIRLINDPNLHQDFLFGPPDLTEDKIKALHRLSLANTTPTW